MLEDVAGIRKVVLACGTVDLRKGIDGLAMIIGDKYKQNLFEKGTLFLFCGQRCDRRKGLLWMGTGFLLLYKRFEDGRLSWPRTTQEAAELTEEQFHYLMLGLNPLEPDGRPAGSKSYMWVHLTGELSPDPRIVVYEYQKTRHSDHPKEYYKDFKGILVTDGLSQYHKIARELEYLENANCWAHARRDFSDAIKAIGKGNQKAIKESVAYKALVRIGAIYDLEGALRELTPEERLKERQASIKPLVEEYFTWVKETLENKTLLPKGKTADGLHYSINQESYLKLFLTDGEIPIDNSASERALRNFTLGRKNWMTINTLRGAQASAIIYSITETARANKLNVYYYIRHLLTELPKLLDENGNIEQSQLEPFMPWSKDLPVDCYSKRRD